LATAYLCLGGNLGDRDRNLATARTAIEKAFGAVRFSRIYETEPVDYLDQPWFLNQVAEIQTELPPGSLLEWARDLESRMGRQRDIPQGPRTLDVDILLYDDKVSTDAKLTLPHPRLHLRRHVLVPLAELAPDKRLPPGLETVRQVLENVKDFSQVKPHAPA
jgi:2-amino-4-hydroxy-6-hydroxymethyldihydropteridine diphosphokinase